MSRSYAADGGDDMMTMMMMIIAPTSKSANVPADIRVRLILLTVLPVHNNCLPVCVPAEEILVIILTEGIQIKSRRVRWGGNVDCMERRGMYRGFWWESHNERDSYEDIHAGGRIILKRILDSPIHWLQRVSFSEGKVAGK
jgi:hypothetical protein